MLLPRRLRARSVTRTSRKSQGQQNLARQCGRLGGVDHSRTTSAVTPSTRANVASRVQPPFHNMGKLRHEDALAPQVVRHLTTAAHIQ